MQSAANEFVKNGRKKNGKRDCLTHIMKTLRNSEMSVAFYQYTWSNIPEDLNPGKNSVKPEISQNVASKEINIDEL